MKTIRISIEKDKEVFRFDVTDYPHHEHDHCKFEVFHNGLFVASFEPDKNRLLHVCKNTRQFDEQFLHLIADKLETMNL